MRVMQLRSYVRIFLFSSYGNTAQVLAQLIQLDCYGAIVTTSLVDMHVRLSFPLVPDLFTFVTFQVTRDRKSSAPPD